jgi:DNA-binding MarR family transcriptional regulator
MPDNTTGSEFAIRDGRIGRWGFIFLDDMDTDEFRSLKPAVVRVYMVLCTFAQRETGDCYPSQSTVATITGLSRETVSRGIADLCKAGLLDKRAEKRPGKYDLVVYTLLRAPSRRPQYVDPPSRY